MSDLRLLIVVESQERIECRSDSRNGLMKEVESMEFHYVYVVRCANDRLYTGYTKDVEQRIVVHNAGRGGRYTSAHRPVELVAAWQFPTKRAAMQVEYQIKQMKRERKLAIVSGEEIPQWLPWCRGLN